MDPARFTQVDPTTWRVEPHGDMRVPAIIYADGKLTEHVETTGKAYGIIDPSRI